MSTAPLPSLADQPDWKQSGPEIVCPLCEYNLRGLTEPRCPECGYRFVWRDLLDPDRRVHPYLFEHKHGLAPGAFLKTAFMNLRPRRFWTTLGPQQPSNPRRLMAYWAVVACVGMAGIFGAYGLSELRAYLLPKAPAIMVTFRAARIRVPAGPPYEYQWKHISQYLLLAAILVAWPWFTFLGLMIFQISMRQAKVRPIHVLRGVLYASSVVFWAGLVSLAWYAGRAAMMSAMGVNSIRFHRYDALLFMIPTEIAFTACLEVAFSRYLRFPHALATILSAQIIVALTVAAAILFAQNITNWPP